MAPATRAQIVALSEVDFVTSASGGYQDTDTLLLMVDSKRFAIEDVFELHRFKGISANFNVTDPKVPDFGAVRARSPLVAKLRDQAGQHSFWLIVNHLARGEENLRTDQARALKQWGTD